MLNSHSRRTPATTPVDLALPSAKPHRWDFRFVQVGAAAVALSGYLLSAAPVSAQVLSYANQPQTNSQEQFWLSQRPADTAAPDSDQVTDDQSAPDDTALPARLQRQVVALNTTESPGTIIIDTPNTYLYYVLGQGRAIRYGVGVGREGFTWSGVQSVSRKAEWPDWIPPAEMITRQPYLPRFMAGGEGNPLGARAMYLGSTTYRIHGTNDPSTIGKFVSSGCVRLTNADVEDLFNRVNVGTKVVVLPKTGYDQLESNTARSLRSSQLKSVTTISVRKPAVVKISGLDESLM
jgi:lipoprotein-anchoring transpeptidase ErfK/SrfK